MDDKRKRMFEDIPFFSLFIFENKFMIFFFFVNFVTQIVVFLTYFCRNIEINLVFFTKIIIIDNESL